MRAIGIAVSAALCVLLTTSTSAAPQSATMGDGPLSVPLPVHPGQVVWVTTSGGTVLTGTVRSMSASALGLVSMGVDRSVALREIELIEARDSAWNGTRNGALIGAGAGGVVAGVIGVGLRCRRDCGAGYNAGRDVMKGITAGALFGAGGGALAGWVIDSLVRGRDVVYRPEAHDDRRPSLVPVLSRTRAAIYGSLRW